jgi:hypothetical protein
MRSGPFEKPIRRSNREWVEQQQYQRPGEPRSRRAPCLAHADILPTSRHGIPALVMKHQAEKKRRAPVEKLL